MAFNNFGISRPTFQFAFDGIGFKFLKLMTVIRFFRISTEPFIVGSGLGMTLDFDLVFWIVGF